MIRRGNEEPGKGTPGETVERADILEEIGIEDLAVDGICGVY